MNRHSLIVLSMALLIGGASSAFSADPAQEPAEAPPRASAQGGRIGVVSVDRVFKEYKATQSKEAELQKLTDSKRAEREKKATEIRNMRDELALLNEENREKQRREIERKLQGLAAFDQQAKSELGSQREEAIGALLKEIEQVVNSMAKEKGYDLILTDRAVLYRGEALDLTDRVILVLNERYAKDGRGS